MLQAAGVLIPQEDEAELPALFRRQAPRRPAPSRPTKRAAMESNEKEAVEVSEHETPEDKLEREADAYDVRSLNMQCFIVFLASRANLTFITLSVIPATFGEFAFCS